MDYREIPVTRKPTKPQLAALKRIALFPAGTFYEQFPGGCDGAMRGRMTDAGWITYEWAHGSDRARVGGGYRLTDAGRALVQA